MVNIRRLSLLVLIVCLLTGILSAEIPDKDKKFFAAFTKTKRNINATKLQYMERFFPLVGLTKDDAVNIYNYTHKTPVTYPDMLKNVEGITPEKIKILMKYFVFEQPQKTTTPKSKTDLSVGEEETIDDIIESSIGESTDEETDELEILQKYKDEPLDINQASMAELQEFPWITPILGLQIIKYRQEKGGFKKISDLKKVPGMTDDVYNNLKQFITVGKVYEVVKGKKVKVPPKLSGKIITRVLCDYPYSEEYLKNGVYNRYVHNPIGLKEKGVIKYGSLAEAGYMAERDVGEEDWNDSQKYYLQLNNLYFVKKFIFGNYRLYFGQGLVLYPAGGPMKGGEVITIKQKSRGIRTDLASDENAYYYGPAIQIGIDWIDVYAFYSFKWYDATVEDQGTRNVASDYDDDTPDDPSDNIISSFDTADDGKHLTTSDKKKIDTLQRKFIGSRIEVNPMPEIKAGITYFHSTYSIPINPEVKNNYYYKFRGDWLDAFGLDFDYIYKSINFFGEIAWSFFPKIDDPIYYDPYNPDNSNKKDSGMGIVLGSVLDVGKFETAVLYRKYDKNFYNFDNGGFQESDDENEEGFYWATRLKLDRETKVWLYLDAYRTEWRKYNEIMPTRGYEVYGQLERKFLRKFKYTFRTKIENKDMKVSQASTGISKLIWVQNDWRIRNEIQWQPATSIRYKLRYEFSRTEYEDLNTLYNGYMIFADIQYKPTKRLTFYVRDIVFDGVYEAGIWEYENTIPSYMENNSFNGQGNRFYFMIKDDIDKNLLWAFKMARTTYFKATSITVNPIGEEQTLSESEQAANLLGNSQYDFRLEVQYKF